MDSPGSIPELGSSSNMADGLPTRAMPRASLRLLPPLYVPAGRKAMAGGIDTRLMTLHTSCLTTLASMPYSTAHFTFSLMSPGSPPVAQNPLQTFHLTAVTCLRSNYHKACCMCPKSAQAEAWNLFRSDWTGPQLKGLGQGRFSTPMLTAGSSSLCCWLKLHMLSSGEVTFFIGEAKSRKHTVLHGKDMGCCLLHSTDCAC